MNITSRVLYEDNHLIAVNKLPGELSQGDSSNRSSLNNEVKKYIKEMYQKPGNVFLGIVHRLDFPVSGVIIYAKTSKCASRISEQIRKHSMYKIYIALSSIKQKNSLVSDWTRVESNLVRDHDITRSTQKPCNESKKGILHYKTICSNKTYALNLVKLETGRKHQIRCQLSDLGLPIIGDTKYGGIVTCDADTIYLHSAYISLLHPTKKDKITFQAKVPDYFNEYIDVPKSINYT